MRVLIIRHGDPDYTTDSLTAQGRIEAAALSDRLIHEDIDYFYTSPLGRARETAKYTLERCGKEALIHDWLREFDMGIHRPDRHDIAWDFLPSVWTSVPEYFDKDRWTEGIHTKGTEIGDYYKEVTTSFDALLHTHGYRRNGLLYEAVRSNHDTIAIFCHFGLGSVLASHLLGVSPMVMWHGTVMRTSSVTTFVTEERQEGTAVFRMMGLGDVSHLYAKGIEPGIGARFVECFHDEGRHN